jgi:hypothetical protein
MPQINPSRPDDQPDENPYAPPRTEIRPAVSEQETDEDGNQRTKHLRRESCIRIAGLIGLILAACVVLTFGLGTLSELSRQDEEGIPPWMYRRWVARMTCVISIAILAFVTSWGLFRRRNWGRWALTIVSTLPVPALVCGWILLNRSQNPAVQEILNLVSGLTTLSVMSAISCPLLLFLMWSPKGAMVFSPEYSETIRRTPGARGGCSGIFPALAALYAEAASYLVLLLTVLSVLVMLGVIRSI